MNPIPMPQSPPPRIIRRPAAEGEPASFEATWGSEAPATPAERRAAAQQKRRQRPARLLKP
jgi:hypothetical protein